MLESVLGEQVLGRGLMDYLNRHKFSNAKTDDLWNSLSQSTNESVEVKVNYVYGENVYRGRHLRRNSFSINVSIIRNLKFFFVNRR